jgi:hypothetical protein
MKLLFSILLLLAAGAEAQARDRDCVEFDWQKGHRFIPGCSGSTVMPDGQQIEFTMNQMGLRDKDYSPSPPRNTFRILFMGPSLAVNYGPESGVVPGLEAELERILRADRQSPFARSYRRIEVIAAAESGYTVIQSHLRLQELLNAYKPHLVLFLDTFGGISLQVLFDHVTAMGRHPQTGLVSFYGPKSMFWPLPESWNWRIWRYSWAWQAHIFSVALRQAILKYHLRFFPSRICGKLPEGASCTVDLYFAYLESMRQQSEMAGVPFAVLWQSRYLRDQNRTQEPPENQVSRKIVAWYKPEWVAGFLAPWEHLTLDDEKRYVELLESGLVPSVNIGPEFWEARKGSARLNPEEYHLEEPYANRLGAEIAPKIYERLLELPPPRAGSRNRR